MAAYHDTKKIKKICKFCESEFFTAKSDKEFCSCACKTNYTYEAKEGKND